MQPSPLGPTKVPPARAHHTWSLEITQEISKGGPCLLCRCGHHRPFFESTENPKSVRLGRLWALPASQPLRRGHCTETVGPGASLAGRVGGRRSDQNLEPSLDHSHPQGAIVSSLFVHTSRMANYFWSPGFVNKVLLKHVHTGLFTHCLWLLLH